MTTKNRTLRNRKVGCDAQSHGENSRSIPLFASDRVGQSVTASAVDDDVLRVQIRETFAPTSEETVSPF